VKSKTVKRTVFPIWNEGLTLPSSNNIKGHLLHVSVFDWKFIAQKHLLGEATLPLDDLKSGLEKDIWLNLSNQSNLNPSVHIVLSHKVDYKTKILVCYGSEPLIEYELLREVKLETQINVLCQLAKATGDISSYVLQLKDSEHIISQENLLDTSFELVPNSVVKLIVRPNLQVQSALEALKNEATQKRAIFDLKNQLQDAAFAKAFFSQDGVSAIISTVIASNGNTLAYSLSALECAMNYGFGWDFPQSLVEKIVLLMVDSPNLNVKSGALKVGHHLAGSKNHGYPTLMSAIEKQPFSIQTNSVSPRKDLVACQSFFSKLFANFDSFDVFMQLSTFEFVNCLLLSAPNMDKRDEIIEVLEKDSLSMIFKSQMKGFESAEQRNSISQYLRIKYCLVEGTMPEPYNKENRIHERMLLELWDLVFPDRKLENRVSEQWKAMGFQGTDPASDFRGMGILALRHLIYFAKIHGDEFRALVRSQEDNNDTYYPVAVAGINISKLLFDLLGQSSEKYAGQLKYLQLLSSHRNAFEEIYCICMQFFDKTWEEMEASYFNFSSVMTTITAQIVGILSDPQTISVEKFRESLMCISNASSSSADDTSSSVIYGTAPSNSFNGYGITPTKSKRLKKSLKSAKTPFFAKLTGSSNSNSSGSGGAGSSNSSSGAGGNSGAQSSGNSNSITISGGNSNSSGSGSGSGSGANAKNAISNKNKGGRIHEAVRNGDIKMVSQCIKEGVSVNELNDQSQSPLHVAVSCANLDMIRLLLWRDADVDIRNDAGWTALHDACRSCSLETIEVLLHKGASPCIPNNEGVLPIHYLVGRRFEDAESFYTVLDEMLSKGVDINNNKNHNEETPLLYAVTRCIVDSVRFLLEHGAEVNTKNRKGFTALQIAILHADKELVSLLLAHNADVNVPCKDGENCLTLAEKFPPILELLSEHRSRKEGASSKPPVPTVPVVPPTKSTVPVMSADPPNDSEVPLIGPTSISDTKTPPVPVATDSKALSKARPLPTPTRIVQGVRVSHQHAEALRQIRCFHGLLSREDAERAVLAMGSPCFLLRSSSVRDCFALTLSRSNSDGNTTVMHYLIYPRDGKGLSIQDCDEDQGIYRSLVELINQSPLLKGYLPVSSPISSTQSASNNNNRDAPPLATTENGRSTPLMTRADALLKILKSAIDDSFSSNSTRQELKQAITSLNEIL